MGLNEKFSFHNPCGFSWKYIYDKIKPRKVILGKRASKRKIELVKIKGIGTSRAKKLQEHGITDVEAFYKIDDSTLKEILGLGYRAVHQMKEESSILLGNKSSK